MPLCLVMIVKDEAAILGRCLASALPLIDSWCIVDTGSRDDTPAIARQMLAGLPGQVFERPWKNFGHNRTESVMLAAAMTPMAERASTWALLLDADFELVADKDFDKTQLSAPAYFLEQRDGVLEYLNVRLLRLDKEWICQEPTHEYWDFPADTTALKSLSIRDHSDGSSHSDKYARDRALLLEDLRKHPSKERSVFYLAQTLEGMGDECCLDLYSARATMSGHSEEAWMARYRRARILLEKDIKRYKLGSSIGRALCDIGQAQGVAEMLRVAAERPTRAEPLWRLATFYREVDMAALGWLFAKRAKGMPKPAMGLFVESAAYGIGIARELGISAYYVGDTLTGALACEELEHAGDGNGLANAHWYTKPLEVAARGNYVVAEAERTFNGVLYNASNPSVLDEALVNVRLVNYEQQRGKEYRFKPGADHIDTKNLLSQDGGASFALLDESILGGWPKAHITGLEDMRLCRHGGRVWFTATTCQVPGARGYPRVVLGRLSEDLRRVDHLVPIAYGTDVEKNWLLWSQGERLRCIYSLSPRVVIEIDPDTGRAEEIERVAWTAPGRFRGSASPVELPSGHSVCVAHDAAHLPDRHVYTHRLIAWKDDELFASSPFFLEHNGIEYCAGMTLLGARLRLSYGYEDREAKWLEVSVDAALGLLGIEGRAERSSSI